jgi:hypothetical protein
MAIAAMMFRAKTLAHSPVASLVWLLKSAKRPLKSRKTSNFSVAAKRASAEY